jgi:hypothetical protein
MGGLRGVERLLLALMPADEDGNVRAERGSAEGRTESYGLPCQRLDEDLHHGEGAELGLGRSRLACLPGPSPWLYYGCSTAASYRAEQLLLSCSCCCLESFALAAAARQQAPPSTG